MIVEKIVLTFTCTVAIMFAEGNSMLRNNEIIEDIVAKLRGGKDMRDGNILRREHRNIDSNGITSGTYILFPETNTIVKDYVMTTEQPQSENDASKATRDFVIPTNGELFHDDMRYYGANDPSKVTREFVIPTNGELFQDDMRDDGVDAPSKTTQDFVIPPNGELFHDDMRDYGVDVTSKTTQDFIIPTNEELFHDDMRNYGGNDPSKTTQDFVIPPNGELFHDDMGDYGANNPSKTTQDFIIPTNEELFHDDMRNYGVTVNDPSKTTQDFIIPTNEELFHDDMSNYGSGTMGKSPTDDGFSEKLHAILKDAANKDEVFKKLEKRVQAFVSLLCAKLQQTGDPKAMAAGMACKALAPIIVRLILKLFLHHIVNVGHDTLLNHSKQGSQVTPTPISAKPFEHNLEYVPSKA